MTQETYSKYRIGGNLENVLNNVRQIKILKDKANSRFPKIIFQFIKNKYNNHEVLELKEKYSEMGADAYHITELSLLFKSNDVQIAKQWLTEKDYLSREYFDVDRWPLYKTCEFLYKFMVIEHDGGISPCCYTSRKEDEFSFFDNSKTINEMFNSDHFMKARELFKSPGEKRNESFVCIGCSIFESYKEI